MPRCGRELNFDNSFWKLLTEWSICSYIRKHNRYDSEMLQCVVNNINFFQQIVSTAAYRNFKDYDEAQDRQIEDAVRTFVKTHGLKRVESKSLEDKKPEVI